MYLYKFFKTFSSVSIDDFEQVKVYWVGTPTSFKISTKWREDLYNIFLIEIEEQMC